MLAAIGYRVVVHDPYAADSDAVELVGLDELLAVADVITLHVPLTDATRGLIDAAALASMRPRAHLVNTCRGGLVDEVALAAALRDGRLGGAGLDVFAIEPLPAGSPLRDAPNTILTPHAAWYSPSSLAELPVRAARQVVDFLAGRPVPALLTPA
jgi:D-3-phosphoglycerate dehydrogenase